jgi:hypothetical protein
VRQLQFLSCQQKLRNFLINYAIKCGLSPAFRFFAASPFP